MQRKTQADFTLQKLETCVETRAESYNITRREKLNFRIEKANPIAVRKHNYTFLL